MSFDLKDLAARAFAEKITNLAEESDTSTTTMIGACLRILAGLYTILPAPAKRDFISSLHRFANALSHLDPKVITR